MSHFCMECGKENSGEGKYCKFCGAPLAYDFINDQMVQRRETFEQYQPPVRKSNKKIIAILAAAAAVIIVAVILLNNSKAMDAKSLLSGYFDHVGSMNSLTFDYTMNAAGQMSGSANFYEEDASWDNTITNGNYNTYMSQYMMKEGDVFVTYSKYSTTSDWQKKTTYSPEVSKTNVIPAPDPASCKTEQVQRNGKKQYRVFCRLPFSSTKGCWHILTGSLNTFNDVEDAITKLNKQGYDIPTMVEADYYFDAATGELESVKFDMSEVFGKLEQVTLPLASAYMEEALKDESVQELLEEILDNSGLDSSEKENIQNSLKDNSLQDSMINAASGYTTIVTIDNIRINQGDAIVLPPEASNAVDMTEASADRKSGSSSSITPKATTDNISLSMISDDVNKQILAQLDDEVTAFYAEQDSHKDGLRTEYTYTPLGYYLLTSKDGSSKNQLYLVYRVDFSKVVDKDKDGNRYLKDVDDSAYRYMKYKNVAVQDDGTVYVNLLDYDTPYFKGFAGGYDSSTKFKTEDGDSYFGYKSLDLLYNQEVASQLSKWTFETNIEE